MICGCCRSDVYSPLWRARGGLRVQSPIPVATWPTCQRLVKGNSITFRRHFLYFLWACLLFVPLFCWIWDPMGANPTFTCSLQSIQALCESRLWPNFLLTRKGKTKT
ncbi:hypothetical protein KP509_03G056900 [Ceratopteris richardii]|uniref:Uncharacterized protein n=1 Tax=Ceratopteris richardii TaxID=49495 RepID=A0A8T2V360_CERRI|nr:hypothetical protein KP509_03G056900 [Ceratopteris richardii]